MEERNQMMKFGLGLSEKGEAMREVEMVVEVERRRREVKLLEE